MHNTDKRTATEQKGRIGKKEKNFTSSNDNQINAEDTILSMYMYIFVLVDILDAVAAVCPRCIQ